MNLSEFCKGRNLKYDTVRKYVKRNSNLFKNHIKGKHMLLDSTALDILNKKYPEPEQVILVQDRPDTIRELEDLKKKLQIRSDEIIALQRKIIELQPKADLLDNNTRLLEERIAEVDKLKDIQKDISNELDKEKEKSEQLQNEINIVKQMGFFAFKRWKRGNFK